MADGVGITHGGRRVLLKWHKLRRAAGEPPFDLDNLRIGWAAGASVEIDVRRLADGAWICLHDDELDEETDGRGPVAALDSAGAVRLRVAGAGYPPPLLTDVVGAIAGEEAGDAVLQLDLKEPTDRMDDAAVASLAAAIGGIAPRCIVSGYDWGPLARVRQAAAGLRAGFDPYELAKGRTLATAADYDGLARETLATAPDAAMFYLYHRFVTAALDAGVNPVELLKVNGAAVDVWTLDPDTPGIEAILPRVVAAGADQVTTNAPVALARLWARLAS